MMHLQSVYIDRSGDWCRSGDNTGDFYLRHEVDEVISTIKAERDEYRYNLSCARNEIHNMSIGMRDDIKTIAELKDDYKEACDSLQTANLIAKEQKEKTDKLLSCLKNLVMRDLIKDCQMKEIAVKIVKEYDIW